MKNKTNLIWLDLEMTGLRPEPSPNNKEKADYIIEIATIVTDSNLNILAEGPVFAIHQPQAVLSCMDKWNKKQHAQSGLVRRVEQSTTTEQEAERATIIFLEQYLLAKQSPMCGNSICQDRRFLYRYMPKLEAFFHYRNLDVSSIKELVARWAPHLLKAIKKESRHLALEDIKDSINELRYYREHFFHPTP